MREQAKIIIRKAKKEDLNEYLKLRKENLKEYSNLIKNKISVSDKQIKKEFRGIISSPKQILLLVKEDKQIVGYIIGTFLKNIWQKSGYIDDIFILKNYRIKGIASRLIKQFIKILKNKGYKKIQLSVNPKNVGAIKLYKNLGFRIFHFDLRKEWK